MITGKTAQAESFACTALSVTSPKTLPTMAKMSTPLHWLIIQQPQSERSLLEQSRRTCWSWLSTWSNSSIDGKCTMCLLCRDKNRPRWKKQLLMKGVLPRDPGSIARNNSVFYHCCFLRSRSLTCCMWQFISGRKFRQVWNILSVPVSWSTFFRIPCSYCFFLNFAWHFCIVYCHQIHLEENELQFLCFC